MAAFFRNLIPRLVLHQEATEMLCRERQNNSRRHVAPFPANTDMIVPPTSNIEVPLASADTEPTSSPPVAEDSSPDDASTSPDEQGPSSKKQAPSPAADVDVETPFTSQAIADTNAPSADNESELLPSEALETESSDDEASQSIDVPNLLRTKVEVVARRTEQAAKRTVNEIVALPREASSSWLHLTLIVVLHAIGPVVLAVVPIFMIRLPSVNEGLSHNRRFLYGIHSFVELFIIVAFIQTCHFAIPSAEIPVVARATAILVGLAVGKLLLAFIAEAWWSRHADPVFPIPFSFIVAAVIALPCSLLTLRHMTPKRKEPAVRAKFNLCFLTLAAYMLSLFVVGLWGVVFRRLQLYPKWQSVWGLTFQLFEFFCKLPLVAPLVTRLNSKRWIQLSLVVDLIFVSVHTAMLPYFASYSTVIISLVGTLFSLVWRAYSGVDRIMITGGLFWRMLTKPNTEELVTEELGARGFKIPTVIARASVKDIHQLSMRLHGNGAARTFQDWADDSGESSNDLEEPMDVIEKSSTEETEILYDADSTDSLPVDVEDPEEPETPETVTTFADLSKEPEAKVMIDRRKAFANFRYRNSRHSRLNELDWKQRQCFHITDSVSSAVLSIVLRLSGLIISALIRGLPVSEHLNASFQISDEQWRTANIYGWMFLIGTVGVLLAMSAYLIKLNLGGLTLNRVISYMFRDHFWFFFFWFCITQALAIAMMLNHFGADFTLDLDWLSCRGGGRMAWPGCVPM
jgi:hypothetical protein